MNYKIFYFNSTIYNVDREKDFGTYRTATGITDVDCHPELQKCNKAMVEQIKNEVCFIFCCCVLVIQ